MCLFSRGVILVNLKYWRIKKGLTQLQLATLIDTSPGYIHEIERGKKVPSLEMLYRLGESLNVCPKELLKCNCLKCEECKNKYEKDLE